MTQAAMSPRFRATLIILLAVLINGTMIHWCWTLYRDMGLMNIAWTRTSEVSIEKATSLAQIERSIGYGEFIHNFKNYVLRRTPNYDQRTQASLEKVEDAIEGMRALSLQAEDREDLQTISQTVDTYRKNFLRAREADWRALPPAELDRLVYVVTARPWQRSPPCGTAFSRLICPRCKRMSARSARFGARSRQGLF